MHGTRKSLNLYRRPSFKIKTKQNSYYFVFRDLVIFIFPSIRKEEMGRKMDVGERVRRADLKKSLFTLETPNSSQHIMLSN